MFICIASIWDFKGLHGRREEVSCLTVYNHCGNIDPATEQPWLSGFCIGVGSQDWFWAQRRPHREPLLVSCHVEYCLLVVPGCCSLSLNLHVQTWAQQWCKTQFRSNLNSWRTFMAQNWFFFSVQMVCVKIRRFQGWVVSVLFRSKKYLNLKALYFFKCFPS